MITTHERITTLKKAREGILPEELVRMQPKLYAIIQKMISLDQFNRQLISEIVQFLRMEIESNKCSFQNIKSSIDLDNKNIELKIVNPFIEFDIYNLDIKSGSFGIPILNSENSDEFKLSGSKFLINEAYDFGSKHSAEMTKKSRPITMPF